MSTQSVHAWMCKKFMLEDQNIPCTSPSQFVHENPINSPWVSHWACMPVSVAGATVLPLPGAGHSQCPASCETGGNTQNASKHQSIRRAPQYPSSDTFEKEQQLQAVEMWRERWLRRCGAGETLLDGGTPCARSVPRGTGFRMIRRYF